MAMWDPKVYLEFADERSRPFFDLVGQVPAETPAAVVDLGCGPGQLTARLADRWPTAQVVGVDTSPQMTARADEHAGPRVSFQTGDLRDWQSPQPVDVIISNATLQWLPEHRALLPGLVDQLSPGGWLAFQVPGNFDAPSHRLLSELAAQPPYAEHTAGVERPATAEPVDYLSDLAAVGCAVNAWETTYLHRLTGPDPVFRWIAGTGARPVLQALPGELRTRFVADYQAQLRAAYPEQPYGTVLPFRRIFVVARRPS